jgi:3'(2'), 5'-bisphosphate nucleotidase
MVDDRLIQAALTAVGASCRVARTVQRDIEQVRRITKDDKSPVTVADFAVQAVVAMELRGLLGPTLIVGEETSGQLRTAAQSAVLEALVREVAAHRPNVSAHDVLDAIDQCNHDATAQEYWALDPIDGTKGFLRGQQYAIALAYVKNGRVVLGVMGCPNLPADHAAPLDVRAWSDGNSNGLIYAATAGAGTWEYRADGLNAKPRRVRASEYKPGMPIRACESVESSHSKQDDTARILRELAACWASKHGHGGSNGEGRGMPVRLDSQCKYAVVARGQADVYLRLPTSKEYVEKVWDHAAGMIIAQEAGAIVTDIFGASLDFTHGRRLESNRGIVCAAAGLHPHVIDVIERLGLTTRNAVGMPH